MVGPHIDVDCKESLTSISGGIEDKFQIFEKVVVVAINEKGGTHCTGLN